MDIDRNELAEPAEFWEYFIEISKIPRCSGNEAAIREYVKKEAKSLGFETEIDEIGNIVVKNQSKEKNPKSIVLQGHLDMVCEKNSDVTHNFAKDPLKLEVKRVGDKKWITAKGTTLGADNGVSIALGLTLLKKISTSELNFNNLNLELFLTVDEETGLTGAVQMKKDIIHGNYLINLDSEEDDDVTVGCAGGNHFTTEIELSFEDINLSTQNLIPINIEISGLLGGHSGMDIDKERANALILLVQILWKLNQEFKIHIRDFQGGNKHNAIPREARVEIIIKKSEVERIKEKLNQLITQISKRHESVERNMNLRFDLEEIKEDSVSVIIEREQTILLNILYSLPNGVIAIHPTLEDLTHTSLNFAAFNLEAKGCSILISQRSINDYSLRTIFERVNALFSLMPMKYKQIIHSDYPSWTPNFDSPLLDIIKSTYKELNGQDIMIKAVHGGLECAMFKKYFPNMDMVSIGPNVIDPHSPDERLDVESVEKTWNFIVSILTKFNSM